MLNISNHDRDVVNLTYVYPVISRRAGGVSLGINLNPNNMCNWQCVYCQVPNLQRGVAPRIDLDVLAHELDDFLHVLLHDDYMQKNVPKDCRQLKDLAISGNGEPTTCPNFADVVTLILGVMKKYDLNIPLRLISNGSSVHKKSVQKGLTMMAKDHGEIWFKVDAVGKAATLAINGVSLSAKWQLQQVKKAAMFCPTWLQTCVITQQVEDETYEETYLAWLENVLEQGVKLEGVLLYGLARPSMQDGGDELVSADKAWLEKFAQKIESLGLVVRIS